MRQKVVAENNKTDKPQAAKRMKKMPKEPMSKEPMSKEFSSKEFASKEEGDVIEATYAEAQAEPKQDKRLAPGLPFGGRFALIIAISLSIIALITSGLALFEQSTIADNQNALIKDVTQEFDARLANETASLYAALQAQEAELSALQNHILALEEKVVSQSTAAPTGLSAISAEGLIAWQLWQMIRNHQQPSMLMTLVEKLAPSDRKTELQAIIAEADELLAGDLLIEGRTALAASHDRPITDNVAATDNISLMARMTRWAADLVKLQPLEQTQFEQAQFEQAQIEQKQAKPVETHKQASASSATTIAGLRVALTGQQTPQTAAWLAKVEALERLEMRLFMLVDQWLFEEVPHS